MMILCDVDGVLADLTSELLRRYNHDYNDSLTIDHLRTWAFHEYVKPECGRRFYDYMMADDLYDHVAPVEGAQDSVKYLKEEAGLGIVFVTKCTYNMVDQKARWLSLHGFTRSGKGRDLPRDLIVARDKTLLRADLMIEDRGVTALDWVRRTGGRPAILLDYPHNRDVRHEGLIWRAHGWSDVLEVVDYLAGREGMISGTNPTPITPARSHSPGEVGGP